MSERETSQPTRPPTVKMAPMTRARRRRNQFCPSVCAGTVVEKPTPMPPSTEKPT